MLDGLAIQTLQQQPKIQPISGQLPCPLCSAQMVPGKDKPAGYQCGQCEQSFEAIPVDLS